MDIKIGKELGETLKSKGLKIAVAESITGGLFSKMITDTPGSSNYFMGGIVAYSNTAKIKILNIPNSTIKLKGAVSRDTALLMARNVKEILLSDIGVSFTGVAGPSLEERKPVGLVFIGIAYNGSVKVYEKHFSGNRAKIRGESVKFAIKKIIEEIGG